MNRTWAVGLLILTLASFAVPAFAQMDTREGIALQNQILELRRQLDQLRAQGGAAPAYNQAPPPSYPASRQPQVSGDITAQLLDRVSQLEEEVRRLRGQNDELSNRVTQMNADLSKQISDLAFQVQSGGGRAAPPPAGNLAGGLPPASGAPAAPLHRTPEMAMQEGNAALARRDYPAAEAAAKEVIASRSPRAADGQFLYAQALTGERNYPAAAVAYNDAYERAHNGSHAADALLGLANSLSALNDNRAACDALNKLRAEVPNPRPDLAPQIAAARARTQCR